MSDSEKPTIRGLEKFARKREPVDDLGTSAVTKSVEIRGLEKFPNVSVSNKTSEKPLAPEDFDIPEDIAKRIEAYNHNPELLPFEDPEGLIAPGLLLSRNGTDKRRLVTNLYQGSHGVIAQVYIEGDIGPRSTSIEDLKQKIYDGSLVPIDSETG